MEPSTGSQQTDPYSGLENHPQALSEGCDPVGHGQSLDYSWSPSPPPLPPHFEPSLAHPNANAPPVPLPLAPAHGLPPTGIFALPEIPFGYAVAPNWLGAPLPFPNPLGFDNVPPVHAYLDAHGIHEPPPAIDVPAPRHGPLQAERLAHKDTALERKHQRKLEAAQKAAAVAEKKAARDAKKAAEKAAKDMKDVEKKAVKEAKAVKDAEAAEKKAAKVAEAAEKKAAKEAEVAEKKAAKVAKAEKAAEEKAVKAVKAATAKKTARAPRATGTSDDEIEAAGIDPDSETIDIKPIIPTKAWSDNEASKSIEYITSVWKNFKLKRGIVFKHISQKILLGSKTEEQVGSFWDRCWKRFMACRRRVEHTGGGDGDKLEEENRVKEDGNSDIEILLDNEEGLEEKKKVDRTGGSSFTEAQLDLFEQTDLYEMILAVTGDNPEVTKSEEFDLSREFSDSETTPASKTTSRKSDSSAEDRELLKQSMDVISTSIAGFQESRKANTALAERREEREEKADEERRTDLREERDMRKRRMDLDEQAAERARQDEHRRMDVQERQLQIQEDENREKQWATALRLLDDPRPIVQRRGQRMMEKLEAEEMELNEDM